MVTSLCAVDKSMVFSFEQPEKAQSLRVMTLGGSCTAVRLLQLEKALSGISVNAVLERSTDSRLRQLLNTLLPRLVNVAGSDTFLSDVLLKAL